MARLVLSRSLGPFAPSVLSEALGSGSRQGAVEAFDGLLEITEMLDAFRYQVATHIPFKSF